MNDDKAQTAHDCIRFDFCQAPICPLDPHPDRVWYPDEAICQKRGARRDKFVRNQHKIAHVAQNRDFYFSESDLKSRGSVHKGVCGSNPDRTVDPKNDSEGGQMACFSKTTSPNPTVTT